jgi:indole-3-glycerol phosphate synthase
LPETQASERLPGILADIVRTKAAEVGELRPRAKELERAAATSPAARDFRGALAPRGYVSLIAECKRRSPGAGAIRPDLDPADLTRAYAQAGAAALSVLTDVAYFGGSLADLAAAKAATTLPVLRKDFMLDRLQLLEARGAGADAVLLIVRILSDAALMSLHAEAKALGLAVLVEVHDRAELGRALDLGADIIGINNRDLATFRTDIATTLELLEDVPEDVLVVSESGIGGPRDAAFLADGGVDAILVGETLLRAPDPKTMARSLARIPRGGSRAVDRRERVRG